MKAMIFFLKNIWFFITLASIGASWMFITLLILGVKLNFITTQAHLFIAANCLPALVLIGGSHLMWMLNENWLVK